MYSVEHDNVFIALVATSFGHYSHHQASGIQNLKRLVVFNVYAYALYVTSLFKICVYTVCNQHWPDDGHNG